MRQKGYARVRLKIDAFGMGEVVVDGVHMGKVVASTKVFTDVGNPTIVRLEILAEQVEVETTEDVKTVIDWLTPENKPLEHEFEGSPSHRKCKVCRQMERVAAATCPGPLKS